MDSRIGLDYIVENSDYVHKLGAALDTHNITVKKQVFELLSALCAHSLDGYQRAIETLEYFKNLKGERYRLNIVINELDRATIVEYQTTLLAFINCIIISEHKLSERIRIRNEFIGLNLLPVLNNLRRIASSVPDIVVQLEVFDEQKECDEVQSFQCADGINLNSHLDVFYAILRQVADTPQEIPFLSILQHLLRIDSKEPISDIIWDTAEKLVHRTTLVENFEDSLRLLRSPSVQKFSCSNCRNDITSPNRKPSLIAASQLNQSFVVTTNSTNIQAILVPPSGGVPPPPPPPPLSGGVPPPPPPPMMGVDTSCSPIVLRKVINSIQQPYTSVATNDEQRVKYNLEHIELKPLPQQETPIPRAKMKTINWNKIPPNKVVGKNNIWSLVADSHQNSPMADLNWDEMEGLFCQQQSTSAQVSPKLGGRESTDCDRRLTSKRENEIILLDGKRSLNVNIFLKQFRSSNENIIQLIKDGEDDVIGAEKLKGLLKILPEKDELEMLKSFEGDKSRLGNAEKFLLQLLQVPDYKLRIESMLLKEEFASNLAYLEPNINAMLDASDDLMNNKSLQEVLYMIVVAGNFLNSGGYAGNAAGVKLSSLQKLTDIRANKPGMNLIHFVALQAEKRNTKLLNFPNEISTLDNATKISVEQLNNEINALDKRTKKIKKQVDLPNTDEDIKNQMNSFLEIAEHNVQILKRHMKELDLLRQQLADFFCEDPDTFKMEECFKIFHHFSEKFRLAIKENDKRRQQEEQANIRRKNREDQLRKRHIYSATTPGSEIEFGGMFADNSTNDLRCSPMMNRKRIGSFNSNGDPTNLKDESASPEITPNGTLRRRRSRILGEEDENGLMDFLRSSGHDNNTRERKSASYGSLDRSWARRGTRKRPDILNIDFGEDRERAGSPSPLSESKTMPAQESRPRISKEWRQKIESWLQANENDDKSEEYKRRMRRVTINRRSLETDTESERGSKLDTLPEEKPHSVQTLPATSISFKRQHSNDWNPCVTLKMDVASTMEAIEDSNSKDKSVWRKSNLNVSKIHEIANKEIFSRQRAKEIGTLHSNVEEAKRKNLIASLGDHFPTDKLSLYILKANNDDTPDSSIDTSSSTFVSKNDSVNDINNPEQKSNANMTAMIGSKKKSDNDLHIQSSHPDKPLSTLLSHIPSRQCTHVVYPTDNNGVNKMEIDSDNIETPSSTRRFIGVENKPTTTPCKLNPATLHKTKLVETAAMQNLESFIEIDPLGDGQFDRHSSTRRTRRFKRANDQCFTGEEKSPTSSDTFSPIGENSTYMSNDSTEPQMPSDGKEQSRRMDDLAEKKQTEQEINTRDKSKLVKRVGKIGRSMSRISQEDVREAIRSLKSPTPDRSWSPPREILPSTKLKATSELNDEGFEETQSLVSDTPSHGKDSNSSCTDQQQVAIGSNKWLKSKRLTSTRSTGGTGCESSKKKVLSIKPSATNLQTALNNKQLLERSKSIRSSSSSGGSSQPLASNLLAKRTNSLRQRPISLHTTSMHISTSANNSPSRRNFLNSPANDVERSSSRTSLRSSRSSINSIASYNTVKKMPLKNSSISVSVPASNNVTQNTTNPRKMPFNMQTNANKSALPASRSSSSGSSIGPTAIKASSSRKPPLVTSTTINTSFKENQQSPTKHRLTVSSTGSKSLPISTKSTNRSSFMRPTAASATKIKGK